MKNKVNPGVDFSIGLRPALLRNAKIHYWVNHTLIIATLAVLLAPSFTYAAWWKPYTWLDL